MFWSTSGEAQVYAHLRLKNYVTRPGNVILSRSSVDTSLVREDSSWDCFLILNKYGVLDAPTRQSPHAALSPNFSWRHSLISVLTVEFEWVWKLELQSIPWFAPLFLLHTILGMGFAPRRKQLWSSRFIFDLKSSFLSPFMIWVRSLRSSKKLKSGTFQHYQFEISWHLNLLYRETISLSKQRQNKAEWGTAGINFCSLGLSSQCKRDLINSKEKNREKAKEPSPSTDIQGLHFIDEATEAISENALVFIKYTSWLINNKSSMRICFYCMLQ